MRCAVLHKPGEIKIEDRPDPEPGSNDLLIEVELAGICGSDDSLYQGKVSAPLPMIPGHEAVGTIIHAGKKVKNPKIGQRITIQPNFPCMKCKTCQSGLSNICPDKVRLGLDIDGVFAPYVKIPARYALPVPDSLKSERAVFTEPVAVAYHGLGRAMPQKGQKILVFGAGVIGLIMVQLISMENCDTVAYDIADERLSLARELGAAEGIKSAEDLSLHGPYDLIYETSGAPAALSQIAEVASPGASIVLLGLPGTAHPFTATPVVRKELNIHGSMIYRDEFPAVIDLLEKDMIRTDPMISGIHTLEELSVALEDFANPKRVKTLVNIIAVRNK